MSSREKHHLFKALKVAKREEQVVDGLLDLVFASVEQTNEPLHVEVSDHLAQLRVDVRLDRTRVLVEDRRVDELVFVSCLKFHAVLRAKALLH